eukprot:6199661-Pleurochrysis_carterae.AAC.2
MRAAVASMPLSLSTEAVMPGKLYFVDLPELKGELRVGLWRAEAELSENGTKRRVTWLQRHVGPTTLSRKAFADRPLLSSKQLVHRTVG